VYGSASAHGVSYPVTRLHRWEDTDKSTEQFVATSPGKKVPHRCSQRLASYSGTVRICRFSTPEKPLDELLDGGTAGKILV